MPPYSLAIYSLTGHQKHSTQKKERIEKLNLKSNTFVLGRLLKTVQRYAAGRGYLYDIPDREFVQTVLKK